jgi:hypothetical protein
MSFIFILLLFASYPSPNAQEINYALAVIDGVFIFRVVYYYLPGIGGKTLFTGPIRKVDEIMGTNPEQAANPERNALEGKAQSSQRSGYRLSLGRALLGLLLELLLG